jgi:hypothetical protein
MALTHADVRRLALALPEAYEAEHFDMASFRVNKKIFCTLRDVPRMMVKLDPEDQRNLTAAHPGAIEAVPGTWGLRGSTMVWFDRLDEATVAGLLKLAWSGVAPKRLTKT